MTRQGGGLETNVFIHRKFTPGGRRIEGKTVIKDFRGVFYRKEGLDEERKQRIMALYETYKRRYGADLFPRQRCIQDKKNPGKFLLIQEKIALAKEPDIFYRKKIPEKAQRQLESLVSALKQSYEDATDPDHPITDQKKNAPLDLMGDANLCLTADDSVKYLDVGLTHTDYHDFPEGVLIESFLARIAALECVLGRDPRNFLRENVYADLMGYIRRHVPDDDPLWGDVYNPVTARDTFLDLDISDQMVDENVGDI